MNVYVASSWRNEYQQQVVAELRNAGFEVYDFKHPAEGNLGFHWSEIDKDWQNWTTDQYRAALGHDYAQFGFSRDFDAMKDADACVLVLPCGKSAHLEAGWMEGAGKKVVAFIPPGCKIEPELMYNLMDGVTSDIAEVISMLKEAQTAETQETHAAVIAEMRIFKCRNLQTGKLELCTAIANFFADRLEAAHNREFAEKIESLAATMPDIIQPVIERAIRKALKVQEQMFELASGNAAAMHEALKYVLQFDATDEAAEEDGLTDAERIAEYADHIEECQKKARAALSAPPRNCDIAQDWLRDLYVNFKPPASSKREMPPEWVDAVMAFCRWLVAPATEKEGEGDGN